MTFSKNSKQEYVVGFLFRHNDSQVALIEKINPEWQRGKLNGIGGKIELGETPKEAMIREFKEETGALITTWVPLFYMSLTEADIYFFSSRTPAKIQSMEKEIVGWYSTEGPQFPKDKIINNLEWLIPLAKYNPKELMMGIYQYDPKRKNNDLLGQGEGPSVGS